MVHPLLYIMSEGRLRGHQVQPFNPQGYALQALSRPYGRRIQRYQDFVGPASQQAGEL